MLKTILIALASLFLATSSADTSGVRLQQNNLDTQTGTLEKMMVANGSVAMDVDLNRLNGIRSRSQTSTLRFDVAPNSFFTVLVFNSDLRGPEPGSMTLIPQNFANLPAALSASYNQLAVESTPWGTPFELVIRDQQTGFVFFNIEGHQFDYAANERLLDINKGRLLLSKEFAAILGRPSDTGSVVGKISITATMRPIEITQVVNGEARSVVMPSRVGVANPEAGVPGPDVIVGDLSGLTQPDASSGTQVGLAVGTDSCNAGSVELDWFQTPSNDHPVIPQNLYRMSGGTSNDDRFEQIGQSNVKHAFTALQNNICGFGCTAAANGTHLGVGCSDPYVASLNSGGSGHTLGSRAWINPFTGTYPRADSATPPNSHTGHVHNGTSHRILVEINDLNTTLNPGATYYAEAQYVTPHEYVWCQSHPGQCNMYNNASFRRFNVTGTTSFTFSSVGSTVISKPAISIWAGASFSQIEPDPGNDGIGTVGYKVTNPSPGVWHYEYVVYNQNLDRAIQSFSVPLGAGIAVSNVGFHAPPQQPAFANDGTVGSAGYSSTPWNPVQTASALTWTSETLALNPNANAIRWGTMYNFRFDSNRPPETKNATIGFFKNGVPITVQVQAPGAPTATNGNIGGIITDGQGAPLAGTMVQLSGSQTRRTITDASGNYRFDNVETNGFYTVTPARVNYSFGPASRSFSQLGNTTEAAFTGTPNSVIVSNPIDTTGFFVRQQYLDFLGREPDESGFNFWSDQILECGGDAGCVERRTINVSAAYFLSIEFQQTGGLVDGLYRASYGRAPHYGEFMPDTATVARDVVVGRANWAQLLEANKQAFIDVWVQRADFRAAYDGLPNGAFVDALINHTGGGFNGDREALVSGLNSGHSTRAAALRQIVENEGFVNAKRNESFVMMQYFGYLRRDPDESGYQFWVNKLNQFGGNFEQAEMVKAFLVSSEYRGRFPR